VGPFRSARSSRSLRHPLLVTCPAPFGSARGLAPAVALAEAGACPSFYSGLSGGSAPVPRSTLLNCAAVSAAQLGPFAAVQNGPSNSARRRATRAPRLSRQGAPSFDTCRSTCRSALSGKSGESASPVHCIFPAAWSITRMSLFAFLLENSVIPAKAGIQACPSSKHPFPQVLPLSLGKSGIRNKGTGSRRSLAKAGACPRFSIPILAYPRRPLPGIRTEARLVGPADLPNSRGKPGRVGDAGS